MICLADVHNQLEGCLLTLWTIEIGWLGLEGHQLHGWACLTFVVTGKPERIKKTNRYP
jgi:hypothetical protein